MKIILLLPLLFINAIMAASILHPFRRSSLDQTTISDHALRIAALELSVSQILVQLNGDGRRPSLQRRPEIRRAARSDTSVPALKRLPSTHSNQSGGVRLHEDMEHLSPPDT